MPRTPRVVLPGYPHHVIQRGHNKLPVFVADDDYLFYLNTLAEWKSRLRCKVYSFCLMTNHVHLIINPGEDGANLSRLMKRLGGRYTRRVNQLEGRTGTAWNGRFDSSPIDTDVYLMACCRYVDLNPVRARIVADPAEYRWSSCGHRVGRASWPWLDDHAFHLALGATRVERQTRYREWLQASIPEGERDLIRTAVRRGQLIGGRSFQEVVEQRIGRRVARRKPGRPRRKNGDRSIF